VQLGTFIFNWNAFHTLPEWSHPDEIYVIVDGLHTWGADDYILLEKR